MDDKEMPLGLYWKDKKTTVDKIVLPFQNLEVIETVNESRTSREKGKSDIFYIKPNVEEISWRNKLIWGDNKYAMSALLEKFAGKIDLIYIDPPFATGSNFSTTVIIGDKELEHVKKASAIKELAYRDTWGKGLDSFLQMLYDRFILMRELLNEKGSIYVHLDWRTISHVRIILDEIFGSDKFQREIIWSFDTKSGYKTKTNNWIRSHETILYYSKGDTPIFNKQYYPYPSEYIARFKKIDKDKRRYRDDRTDGRRQYLDESPGIMYSDVWTDINSFQQNSTSGEYTNYDTQKPEALLERIIKSSSNEGDLIADFFCGSGTTGVVAEKLGRRWICADLGRYAIHLSRKRILEIDDCKPFEVLNIGKYERQSWQSMNFGRKSKENTFQEYLEFILKLFKAQSLSGNTYIHGKKGNKLVHVGGVDTPVTLIDIQNAIEETRQLKQNELIVLGWEWEMGLHDVVEQEASKAGIKLLLLNIPREAMDMRAVEAGDIQFFELAYLETDVEKMKNGYKIKLKDFIISNLDLIPEEIRKMIKKWSDYIDYWSVDWNYQNDTFHNTWQDYRTKQKRDLELETDFHNYEKKGIYKVMIKVVDIFGNDTTQLIEIKER